MNELLGGIALGFIANIMIGPITKVAVKYLYMRFATKAALMKNKTLQAIVYGMIANAERLALSGEDKKELVKAQMKKVVPGWVDDLVIDAAFDEFYALLKSNPIQPTE